jgi:hypothetical protein
MAVLQLPSNEKIGVFSDRRVKLHCCNSNSYRTVDRVNEMAYYREWCAGAKRSLQQETCLIDKRSETTVHVLHFVQVCVMLVDGKIRIHHHHVRGCSIRICKESRHAVLSATQILLRANGSKQSSCFWVLQWSPDNVGLGGRTIKVVLISVVKLRLRTVYHLSQIVLRSKRWRDLK